MALAKKYQKRRKYASAAEAKRAADRLGQMIVFHGTPREKHMQMLLALGERATGPAKEEIENRRQRVATVRAMPAEKISALAEMSFVSKPFRFLDSHFDTLNNFFRHGNFVSMKGVFLKAISFAKEPADYNELVEYFSSWANTAKKSNLKYKRQFEKNFWELAVKTAENSGNRRLLRNTLIKASEAGFNF